MAVVVRNNKNYGKEKKKRSSEKTRMRSVDPYYQCMDFVVVVAVLEE